MLSLRHGGALTMIIIYPNGPAFDMHCPNCKGRFLPFPHKATSEQITLTCGLCGPVTPTCVGWESDFPTPFAEVIPPAGTRCD